MSKNQLLICFIWLNIALCLNICGQISKTNAKKTHKNNDRKCQVFISGKLSSNPKPVYPIEAKSANISGRVEVVVEIDEKGNVVEIENINGNELLRNAAIDAAKLAKFSPPKCDGIPTRTTGIIIYNFAPIVLTENYFRPTKLEELSDVSSTDDYYESVLFLTENYKIAVGYADGKYHAEMPLTKGDFSFFLRQTLELIDKRAAISEKNLKESPIYKTYNPQNLKEIEFNPTAPFADSIKILSEKYGIILADENGIFEGNNALNKNDMKEIWRNIFGDEAIPVNFRNIEPQEKEISRGNFAIFLNESLEYLIYRTLP